MEWLTRLLLSRSIEKTQIPVVLEILSQEAPLDKGQKKLARASLGPESITDLISWKALESWKLPRKFRKIAKTLRKSLEMQGYFAPAATPSEH